MVVKLFKKTNTNNTWKGVKTNRVNSVASITREATENLMQLALTININRSLLVKTK